MNVNITGRGVNVSEKFRDYASKKILKLEKYFHQIIDIKVILFTEKLDHAVEIVVFADGVQFYGIEKAAEFYSAVDLLIDKLEGQVRKYKEKQDDYKNISLAELPIVNINDNDSTQIQIEEASGKPIDEIEAFLEMKVANSDFILFKKGIRDIETSVDYSNKCYAVLFKDEDKYRMVEIPFDKIKSNDYNEKNFVEYNLKVVDDSPSNPVIECKETKGNSITSMKVTDAVIKLVESNKPFLPFFNTETNFFNVLYSNGKQIQIIIPAS